MKKFFVLLVLFALGAPAAADSLVPGTPFSLSQATGGNSGLTLTVPGVAGKYFYLTDFSISGSGATTSSIVPVLYYGMSGAGSVDGVQFDGIVPPASTQQVDFHRSYTYPWQSAAPGADIVIFINPFGDGNTGVVARVVGFYQ